MGAALLPRSVLSTFPESRRLRVHLLPRGADRIRTLLIWRKGAAAPKVEALASILAERKQSVQADEPRQQALRSYADLVVLAAEDNQSN